MENKKTKWLVYTVFVGLIPIFCRLLIWGTTTSETLQWLAASDLIAFGLILHISNINEIEHISNEDKSWKTIQNGISIAFIALYSVLFALIILSEGFKNLVDLNTIKTCTFILAVVSFFISFSVFHRISKLKIQGSDE